MQADYVDAPYTNKLYFKLYLGWMGATGAWLQVIIAQLVSDHCSRWECMLHAPLGCIEGL